MKFILTPELGRLCKWLRILNYDAYYFKGRSASLILKALQEDRIIITREKRSFRNSAVKSVVLNQEKLLSQIKELKSVLGLDINIDNIFLRCADCNTVTVKVDKKDIKGKVPSYVYDNQQEFYKCPVCKKIFWRGTHWELAKNYLSEIEKDYLSEIGNDSC